MVFGFAIYCNSSHGACEQGALSWDPSVSGAIGYKIEEKKGRKVNKEKCKENYNLTNKSPPELRRNPRCVFTIRLRLADKVECSVCSAIIYIDEDGGRRERGAGHFQHFLAENRKNPKKINLLIVIFLNFKSQKIQNYKIR